jgi:hypothetical protein
MSFLYRGVHANHPQIAAARMGVVIPGKLDGSVTPEDHNRGGLQHQNPYTSWTDDRKLAERLRNIHGQGGVLLRVRDGAPSAQDTWSWEGSPDEYIEGERLLRGIRIGIEVIL